MIRTSLILLSLQIIILPLHMCTLFLASSSSSCLCSPPPPGFLQITPEGSPQAQRKGEVGGEADVSGSFCLHSSGLEFKPQLTSEECQVLSSEVGAVTMVTKTTKTTQITVTTETGESSTSTTTTRQMSDFNH